MVLSVNSLIMEANIMVPNDANELGVVRATKDVIKAPHILLPVLNTHYICIIHDLLYYT